jgi:hypothetical protein
MFTVAGAGADVELADDGVELAYGDAVELAGAAALLALELLDLELPHAARASAIAGRARNANDLRIEPPFDLIIGPPGPWSARP